MAALIATATGRVALATPAPPADTTTTTTQPYFPDPPHTAWVEPTHMTVRPNTPFTFEVHDCKGGGSAQVWPNGYLTPPNFFVPCVATGYTGPQKGAPGIATITLMSGPDLGPHSVAIYLNPTLLHFLYTVSDDPSVPIPPYHPKPPFTATLAPTEVVVPPDTPYTVTVNDCLAGKPIDVYPTSAPEPTPIQVDCIATGYTGPQDGPPGIATVTLNSPSTPGVYRVGIYLDPIGLHYWVTVTDQLAPTTSATPTTSITTSATLPTTGGSDQLTIVALAVGALGLALLYAARRHGT